MMRFLHFVQNSGLNPIFDIGFSGTVSLGEGIMATTMASLLRPKFLYIQDLMFYTQWLQKFVTSLSLGNRDVITILAYILHTCFGMERYFGAIFSDG